MSYNILAMVDPTSESPLIGTLFERSMHASLKQWIARPGDLCEQVVDDYVIDVIHNDLLIEIQTKNFSKIKTKLNHLLKQHKVLLVHPIPKNKWIIKIDRDHQQLSRRKSPKKGRVEEFFREAVYIPDLLMNSNLSVKILLVNMDEYWTNEKKGSWRRKYWSIADQILKDVVNVMDIQRVDDYLKFFPQNINQPFTNKDLSSELGISYSLAGKISYTLRKMGILKLAGKSGNSYLFMINKKALRK